MTSIKVHHLNCISTCPVGGKLMDGHTDSILRRGHLTCHCQLLETDKGLVLIDTGFGLEDVRHPNDRLSQFFLTLVSPDFREGMTAIRQIEALGFKASDVRHIVMTHLDFDHAGGLDDFPNAQIHIPRVEAEYALQQKTWLDRQRFRPAQWSSRPRWNLYETTSGEEWFGFKNVQRLPQLSQDILLVPLVGHTFGHTGIAIRQGNLWLLNAGDAYFYHAEMDPFTPYCTPGLRFYQWMLEKDRTQRLENQDRLRAVKRDHKDQVLIFCSHDVVEFERLTGRPAGVPIDKIMDENADYAGLQKEFFPQPTADSAHVKQS